MMVQAHCTQAAERSPQLWFREGDLSGGGSAAAATAAATAATTVHCMLPGSTLQAPSCLTYCIAMARLCEAASHPIRRRLSPSSGAGHATTSWPDTSRPRRDDPYRFSHSRTVNRDRAALGNTGHPPKVPFRRLTCAIGARVSQQPAWLSVGVPKPANASRNRQLLDDLPGPPANETSPPARDRSLPSLRFPHHLVRPLQPCPGAIHSLIPPAAARHSPAGLCFSPLLPLLPLLPLPSKYLRPFNCSMSVRPCGV